MHRRKWLSCGLAALWFAGWHFFSFSHVWQHPRVSVPGPLGDNIVMLWNLGWVKYAVAHGSTGFWFQNAYYPSGFLFIWGTHTWLDGVLGFLASPLLPCGPEGTVLWANIVQLLATVFTGVFAMAALRQWGVLRWQIRLLAATAVTFCWFRTFASTGHYHFYGTEWPLFAVFAGSRARRLLRGRFLRAGLLWALLAGALDGLSFLNDQTHAIFATLLLGATFGSLIWSRARLSWRAIVASFGLAAFGALLISSIHLVPVLVAILQKRFEYKVTWLHLPRTVDASSIFLPPNQHLLFGEFVSGIRAEYHLHTEEGPYLGATGYVFLLLGFAGSLAAVRHVSRGRRTRWMTVLGATVLGCVFLVFTMGEFLRIGTHQYGMLPGRILRHIPILNNIRLLMRWIWPVHLCLGLAGATALSILWRHSFTRAKSIFVVVWAALAAMEGKWYPPADPVNIHEPFIDPPGLASAIRSNYRSGGVLLMPLMPAYALSNHFQLLGGYDIPYSTPYTARPPFDIDSVPLQTAEWNTTSASWLRDHEVGMVVFPFADTQPTTSSQIAEYQDWIKAAKRDVPGLKILDRGGRLIR